MILDTDSIFYYLAFASMVLFGGYVVYFRYIGALPDITSELIPEITGPQQNDRVLVFAPHPDDEILGAGGYMALAARAGSEIKVIIVTDGNKQGLKHFRHRETLKGISELGISHHTVEFWDYPDGKLFKFIDDVSEKIADIIRSYNPTVIIFPTSADYHKDHRSLGTVLSALLEGEEYTGKKLEYLIHYPRYPRPEQLAVKRNLLPPVELLRADKDEWRKITLPDEVVTLKKNAVRQHRTQLRIPILKNLLLGFVRRNELFIVK